MNEGFVKLFKSSVNSSVFTNEKFWQLWCYIIMKASYRDKKVPFNGQDIDVPAGAFITGRDVISRDTGQSPQNIRTGLKYLKSTSRITIKSTNRFSVIQVLNWGKYQMSNQQSNQQSNFPLTSHQPATNQLLTTTKNNKNNKKVKKAAAKEFLDEELAAAAISKDYFFSTLDQIVLLRIKRGQKVGKPIKSPATLRAKLQEAFIQDVSEFDVWKEQIEEAEKMGFRAEERLKIKEEECREAINLKPANDLKQERSELMVNFYKLPVEMQSEIRDEAEQQERGRLNVSNENMAIPNQFVEKRILSLMSDMGKFDSSFGIAVNKILQAV